MRAELVSNNSVVESQRLVSSVAEQALEWRHNNGPTPELDASAELLPSKTMWLLKAATDSTLIEISSDAQGEIDDTYVTVRVSMASAHGENEESKRYLASTSSVLPEYADACYGLPGSDNFRAFKPHHALRASLLIHALAAKYTVQAIEQSKQSVAHTATVI